MAEEVPGSEPFDKLRANGGGWPFDRLRASGGGPVRLYALARGRVQGVYFRAFVQRHAQSLGLSGWARNMPGGDTVEVVAEGPRASLEGLLAQVRRGPPGARVDAVEESWMAAEGLGEPFRVR